MKCKNCRYWGADDGEAHHDYPDGLNVCGRVPRLSLDKVSNYWHLGDPTENLIFVIEKEHSNTLAFVQDGEDYIADFVTKPDFGCVQFEAKSDG